MKLRNKLSIFIILTILFFGFLAVLFVYIETKSALLHQEENNLIALSSLKARGVNNIFDSGKNLVKIISKEDFILDYLKNDPVLGEEEVTRHLNHFNVSGLYSSIYIMSTSGITLVSTDPSFVGKDYSFRDYFKKSISGEPWVDAAVGITSKKVGYYFSHPILSKENEVIGAIIAKMSPGLVHDFFSSIDGDNTIKMITDSEGVVVFSNDNSRIYKSLYRLSKDSLDFLKDKRRYEGIGIYSLGYDDLNIKLASVEDSRLCNFFDKDTKEEKIITITHIDNLPFFVVTEFCISQFINKSNSVSFYIGLLVLMSAVVAIFLILYFLKRFLKPLDKLKDLALQVGQENFDNKLDIKTGDELEDLSKAFNYMSDKMKKSYKDLEKKIKKLKSFNSVMVGREIKIKELKDQLAKNKK